MHRCKLTLLPSCRFADTEMEKLSAAQLEMFTKENGVSSFSFFHNPVKLVVFKVVITLRDSVHHYKHWGFVWCRLLQHFSL